LGREISLPKQGLQALAGGELEALAEDYPESNGLAGLIVLEQEFDRRANAWEEAILLANKGKLYRPLKEYGPRTQRVAERLRAEGKIPPEDAAEDPTEPKAGPMTATITGLLHPPEHNERP